MLQAFSRVPPLLWGRVRHKLWQHPGRNTAGHLTQSWREQVALSDTEVLALAQIQMVPQHEHRLDQLFARQGEETLTAQE